MSQFLASDERQLLIELPPLITTVSVATTASAFVVTAVHKQPTYGAYCSSESCSERLSPLTRTWSRTRKLPSVWQLAFIAI